MNHVRMRHQDKWNALSAMTRARLITAGLRMIAKWPARTVMQVRAAMAGDPETWWIPHHFEWGMAMRNALRHEGIEDAELPTGNLDDYYALTVEEALKRSEAPDPQS